MDINFIFEISEICIYKCAIYDVDVKFEGSILHNILEKYNYMHYFNPYMLDLLMDYCIEFNDIVKDIQEQKNDIIQDYISYEEDNFYETKIPELAIDVKWLVEELAGDICKNEIKYNKFIPTNKQAKNIDKFQTLDELYEYLIEFKYEKNIITSYIEVAFRIFNLVDNSLEFAKEYAYKLITDTEHKECLCPACHICYHEGFKCVCE